MLAVARDTCACIYFVSHSSYVLNHMNWELFEPNRYSLATIHSAGTWQVSPAISIIATLGNRSPLLPVTLTHSRVHLKSYRLLASASYKCPDTQTPLTQMAC
jgi:hypothetical protein